MLVLSGARDAGGSFQICVGSRNRPDQPRDILLAVGPNDLCENGRRILSPLEDVTKFLVSQPKSVSKEVLLRYGGTLLPAKVDELNDLLTGLRG